MVTFLIIVAVAVFLWWSLVPARPKEPTLNDIINQSQRRSGKMSNVYRSKALGIYYRANTPMNSEDSNVFTGTENECDSYVARHSNPFL